MSWAEDPLARVTDPGVALRAVGYGFEYVLPHDEFNWIARRAMRSAGRAYDTLPEAIADTVPGDIVAVYPRDTLPLPDPASAADVLASDGTHLFVGDGAWLRVYSLSTGVLLWSVEHDDPIIALAPVDGFVVALLGADAADSAVLVYTAAAGALAASRAAGVGGEFASIGGADAWGADGRATIAIASLGGFVRVFECAYTLAYSEWIFDGDVTYDHGGKIRSVSVDREYVWAAGVVGGVGRMSEGLDVIRLTHGGGLSGGKLFGGSSEQAIVSDGERVFLAQADTDETICFCPWSLVSLWERTIVYNAGHIILGQTKEHWWLRADGRRIFAYAKADGAIARRGPDTVGTFALVGGAHLASVVFGTSNLRVEPALPRVTHYLRRGAVAQEI